jgi:hypothetical protein
VAAAKPPPSVGGRLPSPDRLRSGSPAAFALSRAWVLAVVCTRKGGIGGGPYFWISGGLGA